MPDTYWRLQRVFHDLHLADDYPVLYLHRDRAGLQVGVEERTTGRSYTVCPVLVDEVEPVFGSDGIRDGRVIFERVVFNLCTQSVMGFHTAKAFHDFGEAMRNAFGKTTESEL